MMMKGNWGWGVERENTPCNVQMMCGGIIHQKPL